MKVWLLSLLATVTLVATSTLTLTNNLHKNTVPGASLKKAKLYSWSDYDQEKVKKSASYSMLKSDYKALEWHANNWSESSLPVDEYTFYINFVAYYNGIIDSMIGVAQEMNFQRPEFKKWNSLENILELPKIFRDIPNLTLKLKTSFLKIIKPTYRTIIFLVWDEKELARLDGRILNNNRN